MIVKIKWDKNLKMPQQQTLSLQGLHHQVMAALEDMRGTVGWNF